MSQDHKLICGSLFVFFAATHAGCAGSGLKNIFTRNETDGYHSLDELETEDQAVAETEASDDEVQKPSMANRLVSWRPFSKNEPIAEETSAPIDSEISDVEPDDVSGATPRFLGRAFAKQDSVEPDPFLNPEPKRAGGAKSAPFDAMFHQETAKVDGESKKSEEGFTFEAGPNPKSAKDAIAGKRKGQHQSESTDVDTNAVALGASRKADSTSSNSDDDDDALAKRFEQHFLLNSIGTAAKTETEAAAVGDDLRQKVSTRAESKKREISRIADRQINQFEFQLAADSDESTSEFGSNYDAARLQSANRNISTSEKSGNSLAAFDQFVETDDSVTSHDETEVTNTAGQRPMKKAGALDINVADAEALFGAAAARQNARLQQSGAAHRAESAERHAEGSSPWSQASENLEGIEMEDSRQGRTGFRSDDNGGDVAGAFTRHLSGISDNRRVHNHNAAFGAPAASAGNVEGDDFPAEETPNVRLSNASAFSNEHKIVTANYGTAQPNDVRHSAAPETSTAGEAQFTAAPVAPVSQQESVSEPDSAATRPGLVQSFSTRNWLLLIGGVIVIALLFAPGRTKPLTMNGRPANG